MSPRPDVAPIPEVVEERLAAKVEEASREEEVEDKAPVAQQSYLALTKLGSSEKKVVSPGQGAAAGVPQGKVCRAGKAAGHTSLLKGR